mmetsp:Transcript_7984/g.17072  ORF Transcript_7984/g.17072 Transcript_7984/m.17072 type:complete len:89 (+) Transcript_7984:1448-1714(+)
MSIILLSTNMESYMKLAGAATQKETLAAKGGRNEVFKFDLITQFNRHHQHNNEFVSRWDKKQLGWYKYDVPYFFRAIYTSSLTTRNRL